eukprot:3053980-Prymnesium_polylepis.1
MEEREHLLAADCRATALGPWLTSAPTWLGSSSSFGAVPAILWRHSRSPACPAVQMQLPVEGFPWACLHFTCAWEAKNSSAILTCPPSLAVCQLSEGVWWSF